MDDPIPSRWQLGDGQTTCWQIATDQRLPHADVIEQGGLRVGQVVAYAVDARRNLAITRSVVWPCLRVLPNNTHGSLTRRYGAEAEPRIAIDGVQAAGFTVERIVLDGTLACQGRLGGLVVERRIFPSTTLRCAIERWSLRNDGPAPRRLDVAGPTLSDQVPGPYGLNLLDVACTAPASTTLAPGQSCTFSVLFRARLAGEAEEAVDATVEEQARRALARRVQGDLRLETPDPVLDRAFAFAKLRVAEAINATRGGRMLAPGGLAYYAAVWCNDNVEYAGPFFPFLGDAEGNQASLDTYRLYVPFMRPDYGAIPSSIVAEGVDVWAGAGDRGDAAMYAYGCARFCLAYGDAAVARELWPAIAWCLEYCRRRINADGVVASDCDELEGRLPAGTANLSTSALYYGGLRSAADLERAIGRTDEAAEYDRQADRFAIAIDRFFAATIDGFDTYRYYAGNDRLRSWICLPLCMNLFERRDGTLAALFSDRLWMPDGLASQAGDRTFWDRSTLYGLRGAFQAGATETALHHLTAYTQRRLLGDHVPYPIEAWPEGDQRHLSSESALFCRVVTEGLFGILPTGLDRFRCTPRLPEGWPRMALRSLRAFGGDFDVVVERRGTGLELSVLQAGAVVVRQELAPGATAEIRLVTQPGS